MAKVQTELEEPAYLRGVTDCAEYAERELEAIMDKYMVLGDWSMEDGKCKVDLSIPDILGFRKALVHLNLELENVVGMLSSRRSELFSDFVGSLRLDLNREIEEEAEKQEPATGAL